MGAIVLAAAATCFVALFLGQAVLRLAGAERWNWLAPPVGLSLALLVATPANHVPGRCATVAVVLGLASVAAAVWCLRSPLHRPPLRDLLAAAPVGALVLVPFLTAGRGGILGVGLNNDMAVHLVFVESYLSSAVEAVNPLPRDYPLGPHAMAALLSKGLGIRAELAFSGWTMAIPVITAWTALAVARRASIFGKVVLATVVGMPFLVAAYYGQGSFKELAQAGFVLAVVLLLSGCGPRLGRGRWVPLALLTGGIVSVFSLPGLPWLLVIGGIWLAGLLAIEFRRGRLREVPGVVRRELPALGIGLGVLVLILLPQAHRMWEFISLRNGTGIAVSDIGNLIGPLSGWEAFGVWNNVDFRLPASPAFTGGMWTAFALGLVLYGAIRAFRRGRWLLPLAAAGAMLIWRVSEHSQSPYVSAKALVVASPLLLLVAVLPLVDREPGRRRPWIWLLVPLLCLLLLLRVGIGDVRALRYSSPVGPTDHARQLQGFRPLIAGKPTLFLGGEVYINWELAGVPVQPVALANVPVLPIRPRKAWVDGQALDFDALRASTLNDFEWIVTPRDAASSEPPSQLHLVRRSEDFELWKRVGRIPERSILAEGEWPGRLLECDSEEGRAALTDGGVAAIRPLPKVALLPPTAAPGATFSVPLDLPVGAWELQMPYTSPFPIEVSAPGLKTVLPANLDRPGPRLRVGRLDIRRQRPFSLSFHVEDTALAPAAVQATFGSLVIVPAGGGEEIVPIDQACGKYVDWYRSATS
jgi:hypothetical protein